MADKDRPPEPEPIPNKYHADIDFEKYDWKEIDPPEWITDLDREILALLGNSMLIMTPAIIAKNIERSRSSVSRRLNTLEAGGMVKKVERGHYRISDEGYGRMREEVTHEDLESIKEGFKTIKVLTPEEVQEMNSEN